jgi:hypothetical protein
MSNSKGGISNGSDSGSIYRYLRDRLMALDYRSFQSCVVLWLGASGYRNIRALGRQALRGRRPNPGADLVMESSGLDRVRVAVSLRLWRTPVQKRAVDELRGFMLREGTPAGMIVSPGTFGQSAYAAAKEFPGRKIQLVSGACLAGFLTSNELGVRLIDGRYVLDERFFRSLEALWIPRSAAGSVHLPRAREASRIPFSPPQTAPRSQSTIRLALLAVALLAVWLLVNRVASR